MPLRWLVALILAFAPAVVLAQAKFDMRPTEAMVARLSVAYGTDKREAMREVERAASAHNPLVLYALANALIEDYSERAIFWYHVGRIRATYDALRSRDKSAQNAMLELRKRMSPELRANQFSRRDRLVGIARKAIEWDSSNPRDYDQRWATLFGKAAAGSDGSTSELFVPESEWPAILKRVHDTHLESVQKFVEKKKGG